MEFECRDKNHLKIFSDGSGFEEKVGTAAVLYVDGQMVPELTLRVEMGDNTTHTTYDAELTGGVLAMCILKTTRTRASNNISIYTDCQSIIKAAEYPKSRSG